MDPSSYTRGSRGRGGLNHDAAGLRGRSKNKHWSADGNSTRSSTPNHPDSERWERGGHRGGGRGRGTPRGTGKTFRNVSLRLNGPSQPSHTPVEQPIQVASPANFGYVEEEPQADEDDGLYGDEEEAMEQEGEEGVLPLIHEPELETNEEREKFYQELVKAREQERKTAIAEGKMDDPLVPKRLEDAISIVGTCMDMCPRFERYRRERENNLFEWETIPGTKRVDHNRAVKMYERAAGDKTLPSDLRPPIVLKRTLDYLFHDLLPRGGFSATFNFIRDRSRAVRNDLTMQHIVDPIAIECHDRCARFHILALHFERDRPGFSIPLEEQQLMNTLQSLKEYYSDQRGRYQSPTELEMRVYHRLIHIRDQKERHEDIPEQIIQHPVFKLTTEFRLHVQAKSAPISKTSKLIVTEEGMMIFGQLARVLNEQGSTVMVYLVACLLERLFGKDTIDDIEAIRGDLTIPEIIDGVSSHGRIQEVRPETEENVEEEAQDEAEDIYEDEEEGYDQEEEGGYEPPAQSVFATQAAPSAFPTPTPQPPQPVPVASSAFGNLVATPNVFGSQSVFGAPATSVFGAPSVFSGAFGAPTSVPKPSPPATTTVASPFSAPQPTPPAPSPFAASTNGASTSSIPNFFNIKPATSTPQSTPAAPSIFGGTVNGSPFMNPFQSATQPSTPTPQTTTALNPAAPSFTPPQKPSIFSQPLTFPPTTNVTPKPETTPPIPNFFAKPSAPAEPKTNGASTFTPTPPPTFFNKPTPPSSKSVTPPLNRLTVPILKIDTTPSVSSNSSSSNASPPAASTVVAEVASPRVPPPMPKKQPISLPTTPTTVLQPPSAHLGYLRSTLERAGSGSASGSASSPGLDLSWGSPAGSQEVLSPLVMGSPVAGSDASRPFNNFSPLSTPKTAKRFRADSSPPLPSSPLKKTPSGVFGLANGKGKAPSWEVDEEEEKEMEEKALAFARKSVLVKECYKRWIKRATDRAAYLEAKRRDEEYRAKLNKSVNGRSSQANKHALTMDKKRRMSASMNGGREYAMSPSKKRARMRAAGQYQPPRTDEELAKRFKENHEEHEQRWAKGSFLQTIRKNVVKSNAAILKLPWNVWLSMNPESDATAIWLERKFDVPASGSWVSEAVFSIPLSSAGGPSSVGYPGLIVFERTPLGDVNDELERKYRVLDDCSRLREIVKSLSPKRHFVPSLLVISWGEQDEVSKTSDFTTMVDKLIADSVLQSYQVFAITSATKDLDNKLDTILDSLTLDTEGKLVKMLTLDGVFKLFESAFDSFLIEWIENCTINGRFNWNLYGQLIQSSVALLNVIMKSIQSLLELSGPLDLFPNFDYGSLSDSDSCYDAANEWLSTLASRDDAKLIAMDIQSHRNISQEFPAKIFIDHLFKLTQTRFERIYPKTAESARAILIASINTSLESFKGTIQPYQLKLSQTYNFNARRSPKRRAYSVTTSEPGDSPEAKRPRLAASVTSVSSAIGDIDDASSILTVPSTPKMNGNRQVQTPSPTGSAVSAAPTEEERPTVTVAMLRALTRDLKKKYAVGS
ncbi:hypothetical protein BDN70DRAFT_872349 [Pholiota conissans]|uniref:SAC3/GANP/THP3 conserved domain-containing protein n=1 Tax=Pholiota conissans TaxID=109636 RepID=A0A9P6CXX0_9AGAR|nr:hypothetical protein BDN70DRAFT_872349 [Pholiota conissans]